MVPDVMASTPSLAGRLTQYQLDHKCATCPDPAAPPAGKLHALAADSAFIVSDPPSVTGT